MLEYTTERVLRTKMYAALSAQVRVDEAQPPELRKGLTLEEWKTERYQRWVTARIADAKKAGRLLTDQQLADYKRGFEEGDEARFIGASRVEPVRGVEGVPPNGVMRPHGQRGRITRVLRGQDGLRIVWFLPLPTPTEAIDAAAAQAASAVGNESGVTGEVLVELVVREGTPGYWDLERTPHVELATPAQGARVS